MIKTIAAAVAVSLVLLAPSAFARSDQSFVRAATEANLAEVEVGRLASSRGRDNDVREFGRMLVRDHRSAGKKLGRLARRHDLDVPARPNAGQRAAYRRLSLLRGRSFDAAFLRQMVKDHEGAVNLFRSQSRERRAVTRSFARETLPTLGQHLDHAQALLHQMGSGRTDVREMDRHRDNDRSGMDHRRGERHDDNDDDADDDRRDDNGSDR